LLSLAKAKLQNFATIEVCSYSNDVATSSCNCSIPFFFLAIVHHTPQLEWLTAPGLLPSHVYILSLVDAKYRAIWLYLHCGGGGGIILWHLSCLCRELAVLSAVLYASSVTPAGSSSPD